MSLAALSRSPSMSRILLWFQVCDTIGGPEVNPHNQDRWSYKAENSCSLWEDEEVAEDEEA